TSAKKPKPPAPRSTGPAARPLSSAYHKRSSYWLFEVRRLDAAFSAPKPNIRQGCQRRLTLASASSPLVAIIASATVTRTRHDGFDSAGKLINLIRRSVPIRADALAIEP